MVYLWDYNEKELRKTERGRIFILERMLNYGPDGKKIKLSEVKKHWQEIVPNLLTIRRRLLELLIWGKYQSSPKNKKIEDIDFFSEKKFEFLGKPSTLTLAP